MSTNVSNELQQPTYTAYIVRNTKRRQYFNDASPRGGRWDRFTNAAIFFRESDAARRSHEFNSAAGRDATQVIPVKFFYRKS